MSTRRIQPIANALTLSELAEAMRRLELVGVDFGTVLAREGERDPTLAFVLSGELDILVDDVQLAVLGPGALFGHAQVFGDSAWDVTVKAARPCELLIATGEAYDALRQRAHPVAGALERAALGQLVADLRRFDERISTIAQGEEIVLDRPAGSFLQRLRERLGSGGAAVTESARGLLRSSDLFRDAEPAVVGALAELMTPTRYRTGHLIVTEGEPADRLHFLAEGRVDVFVATEGDHQEPVATLEAGTLFGTTSLLEGRPHAATCVAREQVVTLSLEAGPCRQIVESDRPVGTVLRRALIRALVVQTATARRQLQTLDGWLKERVKREVAEHLYVTRAGVEVARTGSRLGSGGLVLPSP